MVIVDYTALHKMARAFEFATIWLRLWNNRLICQKDTAVETASTQTKPAFAG